MSTRRIVTGHGPDGKSRIVEDRVVEPVELSMMPGTRFTVLWGTDAPAAFVPDGTIPEHATYFPPAGGVRFDVITLPPTSDSEAADAGAAADGPDEQAVAEAEAKLPGLVQVFDPDDPGFHTTATVDLVYLASGRVTLETTEGDPVELHAGDTVVQNATRHAWRNTGDTPATIVNVSLGITRT